MKKCILTAIAALCALCATAQGYQNPILKGFYPDPSLCRVGQDYYMVNSSFHLFPGVPIHHSRDLINWKQIGHCLTRKSQLDLTGTNFWLGIYAPTIRHHSGRFYMITTNVPRGGNFYVWTDDPSGEWSEPIAVDTPGIDPDIYFEGDRCYVLSAAEDQIQLSQIDIATGKRLTPISQIWGGSGGRHPEAPHIYKKDGYYYLVIAEGGTEYGHKVTIARSKSIEGPYESNPANPILTHIGKNASANPIQGTGHADMIQAHDGSWWLACLAFRPQSFTHHLLGRESFLAPVSWPKNQWPVVNGDGTISLEMKCKTLPQTTPEEPETIDSFDKPQLGMQWAHICNPVAENYSLADRKGALRLYGSSVTLSDYGQSPTMVVRRQQHMNFEAIAQMDTRGLKANSEAGISIYMAPNYRYNIAIERSAEGQQIRLSYHLGSIDHTQKVVEMKGEKIWLRVVADTDMYRFSVSSDGLAFESFGAVDCRFLSTETAGGFTGVCIGLYAQGERESYVDIEQFEYSPLKEKELVK